MMNIRQRSVNVNRLQLLEKLRANLELHKTEFEEALGEYQERLLADLKLAVKKVNSTQNPRDLEKFAFHVQFPQDHTDDYVEVIEMLELSVDENINLDAESFRAYFKNEWSWQRHFQQSKTMYATVGSSLTL